jgi:hypothetical protein
MQHDTHTSDAMVSAEEAAILGRFAERATEAANVPTDAYDTNVLFVALIVV